MNLFILDYLAEIFLQVSIREDPFNQNGERRQSLVSGGQRMHSCLFCVFNFSFRTVFARRPLIGIHRLKWLHGSLQVMVRTLVPLYAMNGLNALLAFLSIEESTATKLVSLILSVILEVIQTYSGSRRQCWLQSIILERSLPYESTPRFWTSTILVI
jgi:hypothetical protein